MQSIHSKIVRRSVVATAMIAMGVGAFCTVSAHADDDKMGGKMDSKMMPMGPEDRKMVSEEMTKMKEMAADPQKSEEMTKNVANMMVMEKMSKTMAMDPEFQKQAMEMMADPKIKMVHEDAEKMAKDPEKMKMMQQTIMADPMKMKMVVQHAMMMLMAHDKMNAGGKMMDMKDKMDDKMDDKK